MENIVVFGAVQSGKSTLMGYISSASLDDNAFSQAAAHKERIIRGMEVGHFKSDMILPSFISLDRDELMSFIERNSPGTSKRIHRKNISIENNGAMLTNKYIFIDTPGSRDRQGEQYSGMFEGELGVCVLSAVDLDHFFALDQEQNSQKLRSEERRLFSPIQFWGVYKGYDKLIIALSKSDYFTQNPQRLEEIYSLLKKKMESICEDKVVIIPTSIKLYKRNDMYVRSERNVYSLDPSLSWYSGPVLTSEILRHLHHTALKSSRDFQIAAAIKICMIPNSSNYALRIKCIQGTLTKDTPLTLGPILNGQKEQVYLSGSIKSMKFEDGEFTQQFVEGAIGGIAFDNLYLPMNRSDNQFLQDYKLIPTTLLMSEKYISGNAIKLRIKEDELGNSLIDALMQVQPKAQLQFYWFGKIMSGDLIEHYEENEYLYISLANLSSIVEGTEREFALPYYQENIPYVECPVIMRYNEYRFTNGIERVIVNTHALFHVSELFWLNNESMYSLIMDIEDCFIESETVLAYFEKTTYVSVELSDNGHLTLIIRKVTGNNAHKTYKKIREFTNDGGISQYQLRLIAECKPLS